MFSYENRDFLKLCFKSFLSSLEMSVDVIRIVSRILRKRAFLQLKYPRECVELFCTGLISLYTAKNDKKGYKCWLYLQYLFLDTIKCPGFDITLSFLFHRHKSLFHMKRLYLFFLGRGGGGAKLLSFVVRVVWGTILILAIFVKTSKLPGGFHIKLIGK